MQRTHWLALKVADHGFRQEAPYCHASKGLSSGDHRSTFTVALDRANVLVWQGGTAVASFPAGDLTVGQALAAAQLELVRQGWWEIGDWRTTSGWRA